MQDRVYLRIRVENHCTEVRDTDILLLEEARTRHTQDKEAPPLSPCMSTLSHMQMLSQYV